MKFYALLLSLICIIMFIFQANFAGFTDALVLNQQSWSEPWRFVTSIFLHGDLSHIVFNLFALILFGLILEKLIGSNKFLIVFLASGIAANLISVNFYSSALGASGAIFGIIGGLTIVRPKMIVWAFGLPMPMFIAAILWAIVDILGIFAPSGVGNIAHLSGLGFGLVLGALFKRRRVNNKVSYRIELPESYVKNWEDSWMR